MSEQTLGQNLRRTRGPHTTAVGLTLSTPVAVLTLPPAQMEKLRPGPTRGEIEEDMNGHVAHLSQNLISCDTQCLSKFGIAPVILISRKSDGHLGKSEAVTGVTRVQTGLCLSML